MNDRIVPGKQSYIIINTLCNVRRDWHTVYRQNLPVYAYEIV
jgi:hypothetical protein